jgi:pimeloyl-ACP methyl ester carboxylesterase
VTGPPHYDEFAFFHENAEEYGLEWHGPPTVRRAFLPVEGERRVSALIWGTRSPEIVLLHGWAQNAHIWDTVALALDRPLVAIDLPGHGHSDHRPDGPFNPRTNARDVAIAARAGRTRRRRDVARRADGDRTLRGARRGRWVWRYTRPRIVDAQDLDIPADFATLWDDLDTVRVPIMLVRGGASGSVVDDSDVAELLQRRPSARVELVEGAGHSIQGDRPVELAALVGDFVETDVRF